MNNIKIKAEILKIIAELIEEKDIDITYMDFIEQRYSLKFVMKFRKDGKPYGFSYLCDTDYLAYGLEEVRIRLKNELNNIKTFE